MTIKEKIGTAAIAVLLGIGSTVAVSTPAEAATILSGVSMKDACKDQWIAPTGVALISNSVMGWCCILTDSAGGQHYMGIDVKRECQRVHGGAAYAGYLNFNDPYSWRCYR